MTKDFSQITLFKILYSTWNDRAMIPRKYKLKKDNDFKRVFEKGRYFQKSFIKIKYLRNNLDISRFAFVVGLKASKKATKRNKVKRRLEEVVGGRLDQMKNGFDIVIMVSPDITEKSYSEIEEVFGGLLEEVGLIL